MKEKIKAFLYIVLFSIILLVVIGPVNYTVDRANRLHDIYADMANLIMDGNPVFIETGDLDERMLKLEIIKRLPKTGLTLALGPSFIMSVNKDVVKTNAFYNLATSGSTAYDDLNTLGMLKFYGIKPERLLLSVNAKYFVRAIFGTDEQYKPFHLYGKYYRGEHINSEPHDEHTFFTDIKNLLSIAYFQSNLDYVKKNRRFYIGERYGIWTKADTRNAYMPDGSWVYEKKRRDVMETDIVNACRHFNVVDKLGSHESMDSESKDIFNKTILDLQAQGIMVDLFISPLPPALWKKITESNSTLFENILNFVGQYDGVRIFGSFDPSNYDLTNADYYDPLHIRREKLGVLFKHY
ncbi:MAG: hypothetical protein ACTTKL_01530 [Treponema sp.]